MSYEAQLRADYAAVRARLNPRPPRRPVRSMLTWSTPYVVEVVWSDEERIAAIVAALGETPRIAGIIVATAQHYGLSAEAMMSSSKRQAVARPRMIAMAIARVVSGKSFPEIGRQFGRDHTTPIHAWEKYSALVERSIRRN